MHRPGAGERGDTSQQACPCRFGAARRGRDNHAPFAAVELRLRARRRARRPRSRRRHPSSRRAISQDRSLRMQGLPRSWKMQSNARDGIRAYADDVLGVHWRARR